MQTTNTDYTNYNQCFSVECFLVLIYSNPNVKKVVWSQYRDSQCYIGITSDIYSV